MTPTRFARGSHAFAAQRAINSNFTGGWTGTAVQYIRATGPGYQDQALDMSADGSVVVGSRYLSSQKRYQGWRLDGTGFAILVNGTIHGISANGSVVYGWEGIGSDLDPRRAFRWPQGHAIEYLPSLAGNIEYSYAMDMTADGSMLVGASLGPEGREAVIWAAGAVTGLGELPGGPWGSEANKVTSDGSVIVGASYSEGGLEACVWRDGKIAALGDLPGGEFGSVAYGVSDDGRIITGFALGHAGYVPVVWVDDLGPFPTTEVALAVGVGAEILDEWEIVDAKAVSDDGRWIAAQTRTYSPVTDAVHRIGLPETVAVPEGRSRLSNVSVRTSLVAGQVLTMGMVVDGGLKPVLVRVAGPALTALNVGISGVPDPRMKTFRLRGAAADAVAENDDWDSALASTASRLGAFPFADGSADAGRLLPVSGQTTVEARGDADGIVLVEAYDAAVEASPRFSNLSVRHFAGRDEKALVAGFVIDGAAPKRLLLRAVGPTLQANWGITGVLEDPQIELFNQQGTRIDSNDDWESDDAAALTAAMNEVGAFALQAGSRDSAMVVELTGGGLFTVRVSGAHGGVGETLLEIYELP